MRYFLLFSVTIAIAMLACGIQAKAAAPIYSFETLYDPPVGTNPPQPDPTGGTRADAFHANGGGTAVLQDSIGATSGDHSLRFSMVGGATFSGAITEFIPTAINAPNTTGLAFDLTVPDTNPFAGTFAVIGLKEFGTYQGTTVDGQSQPGVQEQNIALTPGVHHIQLNLIAQTNPINFDSNVPFSTIFGPDPNNQATPSGFEFYINKSNDSPLTVYLDNVTAVTPVTNYPGDTNGDGFVDSADFGTLVNHYLTTTGNGYVDADFDNSGVVDSVDFGILVNNYLTGPGVMSGELNHPGSAELLSAVPEPGSLLVSLAGCVLFLRRSSRRSRPPK